MLPTEVTANGSERTYLHTPYMTIRTVHRRVVLEIRDRAGSEEFRRGIEMCAGVLEANRSTQLLIDARKMRLVLVDDEKWLATFLLPRLAGTPLHWMAVVTPENALARAIVEDLARPRPSGTLSKLFATLDEAVAWLDVPALA